MAYSSWSVVFGEQPSAAKWNILGANDAAFNNGTGLPVANSKSAFVATSETSTTTSFVQLATTTDAVTVTIGTNGMALVAISAVISTSAASGQGALMGFAVSGANTIAASQSQAIGQINQQVVNCSVHYGGTFLLTGLTPGSTTIGARYLVLGSATGTWLNRSIGVVTL
jgi:hypothetical protein